MLKSYKDLKTEVKNGCYGAAITDIITELYSKSIKYLNGIDKEDLISLVPDKEYFSFSEGLSLSRPINATLYNPDIKNWEWLTEKMKSNSFDPSDTDLIRSTLYTVAISFCACVDLLKERDQKTPGTFFEFFIAYFFTWRVGVNPQNSIQILWIMKI
jgi:hypothetical protein